MNTGHGPLRAVLFDLDGTLLDSERMDLLAMSRLFREDIGLTMDESEIATYMGVASRDVLAQLVPDRVDELLPVWLRYQDELRGEVRLFPGIPEALEGLSKSGLRLGVVTGENRLELSGNRRHVDLDGLIEVWICADDAPFAKPHPAPVRLALDALGCRPAQAVMIGDTRFDMEAGREAGTLLGVAMWGVRDPAPLLGYQPEFVFDNPQQIRDLLLA
jgi:HAD superfamily hydrolase (TIGR01509 family)